MLNSSHRAETNCYYLLSLCKFYEGQDQSCMGFPPISHSSDTLQPFGCCTPARPAQGGLCCPKGTALPRQKVGFPSHPWCISANNWQAVVVANTSRDTEGSFGGRILHLRSPLTQVLVPRLHSSAKPWPQGQSWSSCSPYALTGTCKKKGSAYCKRFSLRLFISEQL